MNMIVVVVVVVVVVVIVVVIVVVVVVVVVVVTVAESAAAVVTTSYRCVVKLRPHRDQPFNMSRSQQAHKSLDDSKSHSRTEFTSNSNVVWSSRS